VQQRHLRHLVELFIVLAVLIVSALCNTEPHVRTITINIEVPHYVEQPAFSAAEVQCLADVISGESRGEPLAGQLAVATVVINRSLSPKYPHDLCRIAHQKNQFVPKTSNAQSRRCAQFVLSHLSILQMNNGALFFHSGKLTKTMYGAKYQFTIGGHHFFA
jgi:N-acetylmuramoyl-L-alanine amidase